MVHEVERQFATLDVNPARREVTHDARPILVTDEEFDVIVRRMGREISESVAPQHNADHRRRQPLDAAHHEIASFGLLADHLELGRLGCDARHVGSIPDGLEHFRHISIYFDELDISRYIFGMKRSDPFDPEGGPTRRHRASRLFDYGELRLVLLSLIADAPRHGYELMRMLEARSSGAYSPSPGVIYPTLSWLEDMGFATVEAVGHGRKRYHITVEGRRFLEENAATVEALNARKPKGGPPADAPAPVVRAMENLKVALRLRMKAGDLTAEDIDHIADVIDAAATRVERGRASGSAR